jgi:hypothetical protein
MPEATESGSSPLKDRPHLTEEQRKENHIRSEKKRREAIRKAYDELSEIVPGMQGLGRSEGIVLGATVRLIREKIMERERIIAAAKEKGIDTTDWELPNEIVQAAMKQEQQEMGNAAAQEKK